MKVKDGDRVVELTEDRALFARMLVVAKARTTELRQNIGIYELIVVPRAFFALQRVKRITKGAFFFLGKLYVSFEKVYNNMIGNLISFYRIFVLCNLDVWFRNYGKSCEVPPNLFGLIH